MKYKFTSVIIILLLFIIKNENLLAAEKGYNSMQYIEESSFI